MFVDAGDFSSGNSTTSSSSNTSGSGSDSRSSSSNISGTNSNSVIGSGSISTNTVIIGGNGNNNNIVGSTFGMTTIERRLISVVIGGNVRHDDDNSAGWAENVAMTDTKAAVGAENGSEMEVARPTATWDAGASSRYRAPDIASLLWTYVGPIIFCFGIVGNILILAVMTRRRMRGTSTAVISNIACNISSN